MVQPGTGCSDCAGRGTSRGDTMLGCACLGACLSSHLEKSKERERFGTKNSLKKPLEITGHKPLLSDCSLACRNRISCVLF